jgi:multiple sugar transport system permease protein
VTSQGIEVTAGGTAHGVNLQGRSPKRSGAIAYATAGVLLSVMFVGPLAWAVVRSFQPASGGVGSGGAPPSAADFSHLGLGNYRALFGSSIDIEHYILNSAAVAIATALLAALCATLAGYGLGRFRFRGQGLVFGIILITIMIPFQAILTPLFLELNLVHLTNSLPGLVLFYVTYNLPFGVFVMRNTFAQIPSEMEDAAFVDGASHLQTIVRVFRPLVLPGIATTIVYSFLFSWTEFLGAVTFLVSQSKFTLPVELLNIEIGAYGVVNTGYLMTGAVIAMIPTVVLYLTLQRYYVQGLLAGSLKG